MCFTIHSNGFFVVQNLIQFIVFCVNTGNFFICKQDPDNISFGRIVAKTYNVDTATTATAKIDGQKTLVDIVDAHSHIQTPAKHCMTFRLFPQFYLYSHLLCAGLESRTSIEHGNLPAATHCARQQWLRQQHSQ